MEGLLLSGTRAERLQGSGLMDMLSSQGNPTQAVVAWTNELQRTAASWGHS